MHDSKSSADRGETPLAESLKEAADRFQFLTENVPVQIWSALPDGRLDYVTERTANTLGLTASKLLDEGWQSVVHPDDLAAVVQRWTHSLTTGQEYETEFRLKLADGSYAAHLVRAVPQRSVDGAILRWHGTNTNIEQQRAEQRATAELAARLQVATQRLETLMSVVLALSNARTVDELATVIVDRGSRAIKADSCALYLLDDAGTSLQLVRTRGVSEAVAAELATIRESASPGTFATMRTGTIAWSETTADYTRMHPELAAARSEPTQGPPRPAAFWNVPLIADGKPLGLLGIGFYEPRSAGADEQAFVETLAHQCSQSLLRAIRLGRETRALAHLATTLRSIGDAVIATDTGGHVTLMNAVAEDLTGWPESDAIGRPLDEVFTIFSEATRAKIESPVTLVLREGTVVGLANHTLLRSRSGNERPISDSAAPIRDPAGELAGVVLVFRDVTAEKRGRVRRDFLARAGATLASSLNYRETLGTVAQLAVPELADWCSVELIEPGARESQQVSVAHVDPAKLEWARALSAKYPPDPDAVTGAPQVMRTGKPELYPEIPESLLEAGAQDAEHLEMIRALKLESAMVVPLQGRSGIVGAMSFIYADSGRRYSSDDLEFAVEFARRAAMAIENSRAFKEADEARTNERALRREADIANTAKDEFLATVSHELRTPLNAILGWTVTLRGRDVPPDTDRVLGIIERNARRQARLIDEVLDVSRIISGKLTLNLGPTDIVGVIEAAVESVSAAAQAKGIDIRVATEPLTITADGDRLQQVVWNLLTNAVKFSAKGSSIAIDALREGSVVFISVKDSGEGIRPDVLRYVFEPFRQADASTTRRHGGLGLGLAIVKQLIGAHGGTVEAASEGEGRGATFIVRMPARSVVPAVREVPVAATEAPSSLRPMARLDGLSVLIVDDEEDARAILEQVLRDAGASVTATSNAPEALEAFSASRPDIVVSDIGMPDMDGFALLRKIRSLPAARGGRTPAIALTAYARASDAEKAFDAGFQRHVPKPVDPATLVSVVANLAGIQVA